MATDTTFVATGPGNVGFQVNGNVTVGVEATGTSAAASFHLPATTHGASALKADNPLCNAALCVVGFNHISHTSFGVAVSGQSSGGTAIWGETDSGTGVLGQSSSGVAVQGSSASGRGVFGDSGGDHGVFGQTESSSHAGVFGVNLAVTNAVGFLALNDPRRSQPTGVYGESPSQGVVGFSNGPVGLGVSGEAGQSGSNHDPATGGTGVLGSGYIGVRGETQTGVAVLGRIFGPGLAGRFEGDVEVTGSLSHGGNIDVAGNITVTGDVFLKNRDVAELFPTSDSCQQGVVMIIAANGVLQPCNSDYDKRVLGIISGAGSLRPAITLGQNQSDTPTAPIAMLGTACCLVDADRAPVEVGDLLTSSSTPGHAMKALDYPRSFGAVIGKALASLAHGRGLVPVAVALQ